jgi:hypothetical protein
VTASTRIYVSGAIAFGGQPAIHDLLAAGYSTIIVWSIHVDTKSAFRVLPEDKLKLEL